jgi:U4/U6.U5 tri-snRNP-associated protein 2
LDLPPTPLFANEDDRSAIPQVPLVDLLSKYNGKKIHFDGQSQRKYSINKLPPYLIFCVKRFTKNGFTSEKNPTIINFPLKHLDMKEYLSSESTEQRTKYDLICNVLYEGGDELKTGVFKVDVYHQGSDQWYRIQDLFVDKVMAQMINLSETYIQIWKKS